MKGEQFKPLKTKQFLDKENELPLDVYKALIKCLELLLKNPRHPSLGVKKVQGVKGREIYEARVNQKYRLTFEFLKGNLILLRNVDNHDACLKKP